MQALYTFLSVENIAFEVLGYQISWLELIGTVFNFICVILAARRNIWNWPIGLIGVVLFGILFYQINLYADFLEQVYYLVTGVVGWYLWVRVGRSKGEQNRVQITTNTYTVNLLWVFGIVAVSIVLGWVTANLHIWATVFFPEPADLPYLDAATTTMAFAAQFLMIRRKLECWYLWILVDIIAIGLYWYKGVPFVALLYVLFLVNACYGWWSWRASTNNFPNQIAKEQVCAA